MSRRNCCKPYCENFNFPLGLTSHGTGTICRNYLTVDGEYPHFEWWNYAREEILIDGKAYHFLDPHTYALELPDPPTPESFWLTPTPTVEWQMNISDWGKCKQCGNVYWVSGATGWKDNCLVGKYFATNENTYGGHPIISNTSYNHGYLHAIEIDRDYCDTISFSIAFTAYDSEFRGFDFTNGVLTPFVPPVGWHTDQLIGLNVRIVDTNSDTVCTCAITANTDKSITLNDAFVYKGTGFTYTHERTTHNLEFVPDVPFLNNHVKGAYLLIKDGNTIIADAEITDRNPAKVVLPLETGHYDYSWELHGNFSGWRYIVDVQWIGTALPCEVNGVDQLTWWVPTYNQFSSYWVADCFKGCNISYGDAVNGAPRISATIVSNTTTVLTLDRHNPCIDRDYEISIEIGGDATTCGNEIYGGLDWNPHMIGMPIVVNGATYTITNAVQLPNSFYYKLILDKVVPRKVTWGITGRDAGNHWDYCGWDDGFGGFGAMFVAQWDGAWMYWHNCIDLWQYVLIVEHSEDLIYHFGPCGNFSFQTGTTATITCGTHTRTITQDFPLTYLCCSKQENGDYLVTAEGASEKDDIWEKWYKPLPISLIVPKDEWEASRHKIGWVANAGTEIYGASYWETKDCANWNDYDHCQNCEQTPFPNHSGLPICQLTISGNTNPAWLADTHPCVFNNSFEGAKWVVSGFSVVVDWIDRTCSITQTTWSVWYSGVRIADAWTGEAPYSTQALTVHSNPYGITGVSIKFE